AIATSLSGAAAPSPPQRRRGAAAPLRTAFVATSIAICTLGIYDHRTRPIDDYRAAAMCASHLKGPLVASGYCYLETIVLTNAIWGAAKGQYYSHPERCIDCSVCGIYCPVDAIQNQHGEFIPRVKPKEIPKAEVIKELCTGCEFCVDICPFECIHMIDAEDETVANHYKIAFVEKNKCVACRL